MRPATGASGSRSPRPPPLAGGERPAPGPERNRRAGVVAVVAEQPPEPVGPARALVVGDDERARADAGGGGPRGDRCRGRERVTPAALAARQVALGVGVRSARDVGGEVVLVPALRAACAVAAGHAAHAHTPPPPPR